MKNKKPELLEVLMDYRSDAEKLFATEAWQKGTDCAKQETDMLIYENVCGLIRRILKFDRQ